MPAPLWAHPHLSLLLGIFSSLHCLSGFPGQLGLRKARGKTLRGSLAQPTCRPSRVGMELAENTQSQVEEGVGRAGKESRGHKRILFSACPSSSRILLPWAKVGFC